MKKIIFGALLFVPFLVFGQTTNPLIITWQANNYFPADYAGKAYATRIAQLSSPWSWFKRKIGRYHRRRYQVVRGQLGNRERRGPKTVSLPPRRAKTATKTWVLVDAGNASFENSVRIPIVKPSIVITSFLKDQSVKPGDEVAFQALPFFLQRRFSQKNSPFLADKQSVGYRGRQQTYD